MQKAKVYLEQIYSFMDNQPSIYEVVKVENAVSPKIGNVIKEKDVSDLLLQDIHVTITGRKK